MRVPSRYLLAAAILPLGPWATPASSVVAAAPTTPQGVAQGTQELSIQVGGRARTFRLHLPSGYNNRTAVPLVLNFHGGGGNARAQETKTGFSALSDTHGFIVAYPEGVGGHWNDGRVVARLRQARPIDDVAFVRALIETLSSRHRVDARRIYAVGHSNGAIFAHRLGAEMADKLAAIGSVAGSIPIGADGQPIAPRAGQSRVSVVAIHGTEDTSVPWQGGAVGGAWRGERGGRVLSVPQTMTLWAKHNGCALTPRTQMLPNAQPDDGVRVWRATYLAPRRAGAGAAAEVELYAVQGGGHGWPGGHAKRGEPPVSDINASQVVWKFFVRQARR